MFIHSNSFNYFYINNIKTGKLVNCLGTLIIMNIYKRYKSIIFRAHEILISLIIVQDI